MLSSLQWNCSVKAKTVLTFMAYSRFEPGTLRSGGNAARPRLQRSLTRPADQTIVTGIMGAKQNRNIMILHFKDIVTMEPRENISEWPGYHIQKPGQKCSRVHFFTGVLDIRCNHPVKAVDDKFRAPLSASGDGALDARGIVTLITPAPLTSNAEVEGEKKHEFGAPGSGIGVRSCSCSVIPVPRRPFFRSKVKVTWVQYGCRSTEMTEHEQLRARRRCAKRTIPYYSWRTAPGRERPIESLVSCKTLLEIGHYSISCSRLRSTSHIKFSHLISCETAVFAQKLLKAIKDRLQDFRVWGTWRMVPSGLWVSLETPVPYSLAAPTWSRIMHVPGYHSPPFGYATEMIRPNMSLTVHDEMIGKESWGFNARPAHLPPRRTGFKHQPGHRIFACDNRAGRWRWSVGFFGDLPFPPPFHSSDVPYSPSLTLTSSRDIAVKSRPNLLLTHSLHRPISGADTYTTTSGIFRLFEYFEKSYGDGYVWQTINAYCAQLRLKQGGDTQIRLSIIKCLSSIPFERPGCLAVTDSFLPRFVPAIEASTERQAAVCLRYHSSHYSSRTHLAAFRINNGGLRDINRQACGNSEETSQQSVGWRRERPAVVRCVDCEHRSFWNARMRKKTNSEHVNGTRRRNGRNSSYFRIHRNVMICNRSMLSRIKMCLKAAEDVIDY
ncbi:hypothetical protein PR048_032650 [Dryococelus australis]|uniref:Uncharacterized protein n=1 Tax=Dryococelus australis TaxID=614101 RepID=A0ABQ9G6X2_9NEOP|nr:hypothetical protein PR048_032650 [Dryococelus australis]